MLSCDDMKIQLSDYVKKNKLKYSFNIITDNTGNEVESEQLVYQRYPSIVSYIDSYGALQECIPSAIGYNSYIDVASYNAGSEEIVNQSKCNIYTYNYGSFTGAFSFNFIDDLERSDIYDSHYLAIKATDDGFHNFIITRCDKNEDILINYDDMGTEGITIDKEGKDIFSSEVILTEEIDYFWEDINEALEEHEISVSGLIRNGFIDTVFEKNVIDKEIFENVAKWEFENEYLEEQEYNILIEKGYVSCAAE